MLRSCTCMLPQCNEPHNQLQNVNHDKDFLHSLVQFFSAFISFEAFPAFELVVLRLCCCPVGVRFQCPCHAYIYKFINVLIAAQFNAASIAPKTCIYLNLNDVQARARPLNEPNICMHVCIYMLYYVCIYI